MFSFPTDATRYLLIAYIEVLFLHIALTAGYTKLLPHANMDDYVLLNFFFGIITVSLLLHDHSKRDTDYPGICTSIIQRIIPLNEQEMPAEENNLHYHETRLKTLNIPANDAHKVHKIIHVLKTSPYQEVQKKWHALEKDDLLVFDVDTYTYIASTYDTEFNDLQLYIDSYNNTHTSTSTISTPLSSPSELSFLYLEKLEKELRDISKKNLHVSYAKVPVHLTKRTAYLKEKFNRFL